MKRTILLVDINSFFASVEVSRKPQYKSKPLAVGGATDHGVIAAASYEAREFGVRAGMPTYRAKNLCKDLIVIAPDHDYYVEISNSIFTWLIDNISSKFEPISIDECFIDITDLLNEEPVTALEVAKYIEESIKQLFDLTISIGISENRFLAKTASNFKKPNGISTCYKNEIKSKLWDLPIEKMWSVGLMTLPKLEEEGIKTIGDLANVSSNKETYNNLERKLGLKFEELLSFANGSSSDKVDSDYHELKSIGNSKTLHHWTTDWDEISDLFNKLSQNVSDRAKERNMIGDVITISIRYTKGVSSTRQIKIKQLTNDYKIITNTSIDLFEQLWNDKELKGLGVTLSNLHDKNRTPIQMSFLDLYEVEKLITDYEESDENRILINQLNAQLGYEALITGEDKNTIKKHKNISVSSSDKIKFKTWK